MPVGTFRCASSPDQETVSLRLHVRAEGRRDFCVPNPVCRREGCRDYMLPMPLLQLQELAA